MFIDTHCHIDSYERHAGESFDALLERLAHGSDPNVGLPEAFVHVACDPADFDRARELSEKYDNVYAAYGIHPEYVDTETPEDESRLLECLGQPDVRVGAVGEPFEERVEGFAGMAFV